MKRVVSLIILSFIITLSLPMMSFARLKVKNPSYVGSIQSLDVGDGALWVGTQKAGVIRLDKSTLDFSKAKRFTTCDDLLSNSITGIEVAHGKTFIASEAGLSVIEGDKITNYKKMKGANLTNCIVSSNGKIVMIVGNNKSGGVIVYDGQKYTRIFFYDDELSKIAATLVSNKDSFLIDINANIYKISNGFIGSKTEWEIITPSDDLFVDLLFAIEKIVVDERGVLWIVTEGDMYYYDGKRYAKTKLKELNNANISDVTTSVSGFKYITTSSGVVAYINGRTKKIDIESGLLDNDVTAVISNEGELFLSTGTGIETMTLPSIENE